MLLVQEQRRTDSFQTVGGRKGGLLCACLRLLRLRLINASASRIYRLRLQNHPWFLMATDRGAIAAPTALDTLVLAPGERAELLIPGQQEPGDYRLLSLPYDRGIGTMVTSLGTAVDTMAGVVNPRQTTLAILRYQASERSEPLPLPQQLLPVTPLDIREALGRLRVAHLLAGYRVQSDASEDAIISAVLALQDYVGAPRDRVQAVEVNPLLCTPTRAVAGDALLRTLTEA